MVFQLNKVHGTVQAESKPGHDLITYGKLCGIRQRLQRFLSVGRDTLYKEFLINIQLTALLLHIGYGRQVLRINGSPRDTRIPLLYGNGCRLQFRTALREDFLDVSQSRYNGLAGESVSSTYYLSDADISFAFQQIATLAKQCINRIGGSHRRIPSRRLFLFQQPKLHFFYQSIVAARLAQGSMTATWAGTGIIPQV